MVFQYFLQAISRTNYQQIITAAEVPDAPAIGFGTV
jgi:hypothetical protein